MTKPKVELLRMDAARQRKFRETLKVLTPLERTIRKLPADVGRGFGYTAEEKAEVEEIRKLEAELVAKIDALSLTLTDRLKAAPLTQETAILLAELSGRGSRIVIRSY